MKVLFVPMTRPLHRDALERALSAQADVEVTSADAVHLRQTAVTLTPDVMLVVVGEDARKLHRALTTVELVHPAVPLVVVVPTGEVAMASHLVSRGVAGILTEDDDFTDLMYALHQAQRGKLVFPARLTRHQSAADEASDPVLTPREMEVLEHLAQGRPELEAANTLFITRQTFRTHIRNILRKLGVHSRMAAVLKASQIGLIDLPKTE